MPGRKILSTTEIPAMRRWRVIEVEKGNGTRSRHICGHDVTNDRGCTSSSIKDFDWETMIATTKRGSNYQLVGVPGDSHIWKNVWSNWCRLHGVTSEVDVTDEYFNINRITCS